MTEILCIGSVLWDVIGRAAMPMRVGSDVPGSIEQVPGGVALNIARALAQRGCRPVLLSAVGQDAAGDALLTACRDLGLNTDYMCRVAGRPTDRYMVIEGPQGVMAALADAATLEAAEQTILHPLQDGRLADGGAPYRGVVAVDGNLIPAVLQEMAQSSLLRQSDMRVAPASPGKARRLLPFLHAPHVTLYVNLEEAGLLAQSAFDSAAAAAEELGRMMAGRLLVTDGQSPAACWDGQDIFVHPPPQVAVQRVTGAGDTFMAAHIVAELNGAPASEALVAATQAAAAFVAGETDHG